MDKKESDFGLYHVGVMLALGALVVIFWFSGIGVSGWMAVWRTLMWVIVIVIGSFCSWVTIGALITFAAMQFLGL